MKLGRYRSLRAAAQHVTDLVANNDLNRALRILHDVVESVFTEPLCTDQAAGSRLLDALCREIGEKSLSAVETGSLSIEPASDRPRLVYLVTRVQRSGGHSRVIEDFIRARPKARHLILSTELSGRSDSDYLMSRLSGIADLSIETASTGADYLERLTWLQRRLLEVRPARTYLFNHHQDSIAVAAVPPSIGCPLSFYHHGDHHLCLGVHLAGAEHIDPHPMGYHACRETLGIDNVYVPLTLDDKGGRPADLPFMPGGTLTTCTAARSNKVEITYFLSYLDTVPALLRATGGRHLHIGRLTPWALHRMRRGLRRMGIAKERLVYIPWAPSVWEALHEHHVDLYVASFPYGGGLTLIEALGAGIPVALHRHIYSRVLSGIDLAYQGAFSWRDPDELFEYCREITTGELQDASHKARSQYEAFHKSEILSAVLNETGEHRVVPRSLDESFAIDAAEHVFGLQRQVSMKHILRRGAYRIGRSLKARYF